MNLKSSFIVWGYDSNIKKKNNRTKPLTAFVLDLTFPFCAQLIEMKWNQRGNEFCSVSRGGKHALMKQALLSEKQNNGLTCV